MVGYQPNVCRWINVTHMAFCSLSVICLCIFSRVNGRDCGDAVAGWISEVLGRPGSRLIQQNNNHSRTSKLRDKENGSHY